MTRRIKVIGMIIAVAVLVFGARHLSPIPSTDAGALTFNIEMPPGDQISHDPGRCIPERNVGIAESAEHYYASCRDEQK